MKLTQSSGLFLLIVAIMLSLASCGGDEDTAGIDASGSPLASQGTIDGFGSVIVNGIRFDSSKALILINGQTASEENLRAGYQVTVTGTLNNENEGIADKIEYYPELVGEIAKIDLEKNQLIVLERTVQINNRTLFGNSIMPNDIRGLKLGDKLQISGHLNGQHLLATRIDSSEELIQLSGEISKLNQSNNEFNLTNNQVKYAGANLINIRDNRLENNMRVTVRGIRDATGVLHAREIFKLWNDFSGDIKNLEIEGLVVHFHSMTDFSVNGFRCSTSAQTIYEFGSATDLKLNASVEVYGKLDSAGILIADKIQFDSQDVNHVEGLVTAIQIDSNNYIATGSIQIGDISIKTTNSTRYEDNSNIYNHRFNLTSISVGDYLQITGCNRNGEFVASKIERRTTQGNMEFNFEGKINSTGMNTINLLGHNIVLNSSTEILSRHGKSLSTSEFFAKAINQQVKVRGNLLDGVYTATRIQLMD